MKILIVCTGNTCRSPMAESYLRSLRPDWDVVSAGTAAAVGAPATENAQSVMAEIGLDLSGHRARSVESVSGRAFDRVLAMSPEHLLAVGEWEGELLSSVSGEQAAVPDPYGGSLKEYRQTLSTIKRHLDRLADTVARP